MCDADDDTMIPSDDELLYWLAIRDKAVPHWPLPASVAQMQRATVQVGENGEDTIWLIPPADGGSIPELPSNLGLQSNYSALIGYRTRERQLNAVSIFLTAPIEVARAEAQRALAEETVIRRFVVNPGLQIGGEADGCSGRLNRLRISGLANEPKPRQFRVTVKTVRQLPCARAAYGRHCVYGARGHAPDGSAGRVPRDYRLRSSSGRDRSGERRSAQRSTQ
jgi:hypothetical protein